MPVYGICGVILSQFNMSGINIPGSGRGIGRKSGTIFLCILINIACPAAGGAQSDSLQPEAGGQAGSTIAMRLRGTVGAIGESVDAIVVGATDTSIGPAVPEAGENKRARPVEAGIGRREDENPFSPSGFLAGPWNVNIRFEQAIGFATNADFAPGGEAGVYSYTDGTFAMETDPGRFQVRLEGQAGLRTPLDATGEGIPEAGIAGELNLDLLDGFAVGFSGGYDYTTEAVTSEDLPANVTGRPGVHGTSAGVRISRSGGKLGLELRGTFDRTTYEDADLSTGGVLSQEDRNNNLFSAAARISYAASPVFRPFVEAGLGWRRYDLAVDRNGEARNSIQQDFRAGLEMDFGEKLSGEIAVGYLQEDFEDEGLDTLRTPSFDAELAWSPERDTVVSLSGATVLDTSTSAGESGSAIHSLDLAVNRRVRQNLAIGARAGIIASRSQDNGDMDLAWTGGLGLEYFVNRYQSLTANLEYERYDSADPGESWASTAIRIGMAVQR